MATAPTLKRKLDTLAMQLADEAAASEKPDFRLDAFKALGQYFIGTAKIKKAPADDATGDSFASLKQRAFNQAEGNA